MATSLSDVDVKVLADSAYVVGTTGTVGNQGQVPVNKNKEKVINVHDWLTCYERILEEFNKNGRVPPSFTRDQKCIAHCIGPILCCPCLTWSSFFRVLLSPFVCLLMGPKGMCDGNACTKAPDVFVREYYHLLGAYTKVPSVTPPQSLDIFTDKDLDRYIRILRRSLAIITLDGFNTKEKRKLNYKSIYDLSDSCFHCLPANAPPIIGNMLIEAMRTKEARKYNRKSDNLHI